MNGFSRFSVEYRLAGGVEEARARAKDICYEQTVEFPEELLPEGFIKDHVVGRVESFSEIEPGICRVEISYEIDATAGELTQLLNVIFGNTSIKPGVRVERINLSPDPGDPMPESFHGPRFGIDGLRNLLGVADQPLLATAVKPMGMSAEQLAERSYKCALGGIDIIKDDHGLTDQPYAPFEKRVVLCAEAVAKANNETGFHSMYVPNVTAPADRVMERARFARENGAGGLLISPGLTGFDAMRLLTDDASIGLPIISHPALLGSFVASKESGISHYALFGQLMRLAGADAVIFPNFGGRFSFSRDECCFIADGAKSSMGIIKGIFPVPGGGMSLSSIPESLKVYGADVIFLVGGGLFKLGPDIAANARYFRSLVGR